MKKDVVQFLAQVQVQTGVTYAVMVVPGRVSVKALIVETEPEVPGMVAPVAMGREQVE